MNNKWRSLALLQDNLGKIGGAVSTYFQEQRRKEEVAKLREQLADQYKPKSEVAQQPSTITQTAPLPAGPGGTDWSTQGSFGQPAAAAATPMPVARPLPRSPEGLDILSLFDASANMGAAPMGAYAAATKQTRPDLGELNRFASLYDKRTGEIVREADKSPLGTVGALVIAGQAINSPEEAMAVKAMLPLGHPELPKLDAYLKMSFDRAMSIAGARSDVREGVTVRAEDRKGQVTRAGEFGKQMAEAQDAYAKATATAASLKTGTDFGKRGEARKANLTKAETEARNAKAKWVDGYEKLQRETPEDPSLGQYQQQYQQWKQETGKAPTGQTSPSGRFKFTPIQ